MTLSVRPFLFGSLVLLTILSSPSSALVSTLNLVDDTRSIFLVDSFGFGSAGGGAFSIETISPFEQDGPGSCGFILTVSKTLYKGYFSLTDACAYINGEKNASGTVSLVEKLPFKTGKKEGAFQPGFGGYYHTFFVNCQEAKVSGKFKITQYNINPTTGKRNYLGAGDQGEIPLNAVMCFLYFFALVSWCYYLWRRATGVHKIHHFMTAILVLQVITHIFTTLQLNYLARNGTRGGWAIPYFGFTMLKGAFLFILIALLGSGWSIVKPYLGEREKLIVAVVLPLQIIDNIALVYVEGMGQGESAWSSWYEVFRIFDIICCCAILFPILWSINHLKKAAVTDGKAALSLKRMTIFREFYLIVIFYIYFRIIILYLLSMSLSYTFAWASTAAEELVTISLFCLVGYKFRPLKNNPYLKLDTDDDENVDDDDIIELNITDSTEDAFSADFNLDDDFIIEKDEHKN